ncbi:hypothetical protein TNIN_446091 [Trichonephila inaurata madagascariensis]|uniref:Uncharacterized protein n=1 Tax=Trichonephila inaurata madagascariensis TaxID=2747483 RepID=A0A8X6YPJ6_9ARAC|nr:hypothetical protein TNIN_446081 [Trichonephila inaurata madagascariensis]GFY74687.1 hypothetical protein TNIN_446091 [Trichonephila inaurata madagascariensis]
MGNLPDRRPKIGFSDRGHPSSLSISSGPRDFFFWAWLAVAVIDVTKFSALLRRDEKDSSAMCVQDNVHQMKFRTFIFSVLVHTAADNWIFS